VQVSGAESKMSRRVEPPRSSSGPRLNPKLASSIFGPSTDSWFVAMVEPPVSYLESMVSTAACEMAIVFRSAFLRGLPDRLAQMWATLLGPRVSSLLKEEFGTDRTPQSCEIQILTYRERGTLTDQSISADSELTEAPGLQTRIRRSRSSKHSQSTR
jgi:hypothetical protein